MKAIVNTGPGRLEWLDRPTPPPGNGQVRIRVCACAVCATDLAMIAGWERTGFPAVPGHEWSGVVDAVGPGADGALAGRACVAENVQADGGEVGFEHPGGYGQYLLTDAANVHPLPGDFPLPKGLGEADHPAPDSQQQVVLHRFTCSFQRCIPGLSSYHVLLGSPNGFALGAA